MADSFDVNDKSRAADTTAQIPTSASEVAVRTMASDLELMGQSGGLVGQSAPQGEQVPVTLHPDQEMSKNAEQASASDAPSGSGKIILITISIVVAVVALLALGYFVIGR